MHSGSGRLWRSRCSFIAAGTLLILIGIALPAGAQAPLFGVTGDGATPAESLFSIDPSSAMGTLLGGLGNGNDGEVIAFNPVDGQLYHFSGRGAPNIDAIFERINPRTSRVTSIGFSGGGLNAEAANFAEEAQAATFDLASGEFLVADLDNFLYRVSTEGKVRVLGDMGFRAKGLAFRGSRLLAIEQADSLDSDGMVDLVEIDPTTGAVIDSINVTLSGVALGNTNGLAVDPRTGDVYAIVQGGGSRRLVVIDPVTGRATEIGVLSTKFAAIAFLGHFGIEEFFAESIISAASSALDGGDFLASLPFHGAHHRPLILQPGMDSENCSWATGDVARYRQHKSEVGLFEVGMCRDFLDELRIGLGVGQSYVDQELRFGGESEIDGQYAILEANYRFAGFPVVATVNLLYGDWDAEIDRGLQLGASRLTASGETDVTTKAFRLRFDYTGIDLGSTTLTPRVEYTESDIEVDGYQESGVLALQFDDRDHSAREIRVGLDATLPLGERIHFSVLTEAVKRFDDEAPDIRGSFFGQPWTLAGPDSDDTWFRLGLGFDYRIKGGLHFSAHANVASTGRDARTSGSLGLRYAF
jgi:uncharacterized protein YhjY with autotransporter beta-barrel domain